MGEGRCLTLVLGGARAFSKAPPPPRRFYRPAEAEAVPLHLIRTHHPPPTDSQCPWRGRLPHCFHLPVPLRTPVHFPFPGIHTWSLFHEIGPHILHVKALEAPSGFPSFGSSLSLLILCYPPTHCPQKEDKERCAPHPHHVPAALNSLTTFRGPCPLQGPASFPVSTASAKSSRAAAARPQLPVPCDSPLTPPVGLPTPELCAGCPAGCPAVHTHRSTQHICQG